MPRWTISFSYRTGDSFSSNDTTGELGISWADLDVAKKALARIQEYHKAQEHNRDVDRGWKRGKEIDITKLDGYSPEYPEVCIMLPLDDGTEHRHSRFWDGYFEHLYSAEIVPTNDSKDTDGMRYVP